MRLTLDICECDVARQDVREVWIDHTRLLAVALASVLPALVLSIETEEIIRGRDRVFSPINVRVSINTCFVVWGSLSRLRLSGISC